MKIEGSKLRELLDKSQLGKHLALTLLGIIVLVLGLCLPSTEWSAPANAMRLSPSIFNSQFEPTPRLLWHSVDISRNPNRVDVGFTFSVISQKKLKGKASLLRTSTQENRNLQLVLDLQDGLILKLPTLLDNSWRLREVLVKAGWEQNDPAKIVFAFDETRSFFSVKLNGHPVNLERDLKGEVITPGTILPWFDFLELGTVAATLPVKITEIGVAVGPIPFHINLQYLKLLLLALSFLFLYPAINLFLHSQKFRIYKDKFQCLYTKVDAMILAICLLFTLFIPGEFTHKTEKDISKSSQLQLNKNFELIIEYELISKPILKYAFVLSLGKEFNSGIGLTFDQYGSQFLVLGSKLATGLPLGNYQLIPMNNSELGSHEIVLSYSSATSQNVTIEVTYDGNKIVLIDAVTGVPPIAQNLDLDVLSPIQISPLNEFGASSKVDSLRVRLPVKTLLLSPLFRSAIIIALFIILPVLTSRRRGRKTAGVRSND